MTETSSLLDAVASMTPETRAALLQALAAEPARTSATLVTDKHGSATGVRCPGCSSLHTATDAHHHEVLDDGTTAPFTVKVADEGHLVATWCLTDQHDGFRCDDCGARYYAIEDEGA